MYTSIYAVLLALIPALINFGILLYVSLSFPKTKLVNIFLALMLALMLWQCVDVISRLRISAELVSYWDRVLAIGWLFFAPLFLHFVLYFNDDVKLQKKISVTAIYGPFIIFYIVYINNSAVIYTRYHEFWGWIADPREGTLDLFQRAFMIVPISIGVFILIKIALQKNNSTRRFQAIVLALSISLPLLQGVFTQVFLAADGHEIPVTSSFLTFLSIGAIISLKRFDLFNVSEAISSQEVFESVSSPILAISGLGQIKYANAAAVKRFGLDTDVAKLHIYSLLNPFIKEFFFKRIMLKIQSAETVTDEEIEFIGADGAMFDAMVSCELMKDSKGGVTGGLLMIYDVSRLKEQQRTIEFQLGQMRQIAYIQSHIVRAPLSRVISISDILLKEKEKLSTEEYEQFLMYLNQSAHELDEELHNIVDKTGAANIDED